jgi:hypothetical protein
VEATAEDGAITAFSARLRVDGPAEVEYMANGGILQMVLRQMLSGGPRGGPRSVEPRFAPTRG